jgi:carbonic anhydrase
MDFESFVEEQLAPDLEGAKGPEILLLTCMDYRYAPRIVDVMDRRGLRRKYDMFVLAGASLGANTNPGWREALFDHVKTARTIGHPINKVFILEHRDCGAYAHILGLRWPDVLPGRELEAHREQVEKLSRDLREKFPGLKVVSVLLTRDEDDDLHVESHGSDPA